MIQLTLSDNFLTPSPAVSTNPNCIVLLAQNNADVNVSDAHGSYPIHYAATMAKDPEKLPEDAPKVNTPFENLIKAS